MGGTEVTERVGRNHLVVAPEPIHAAGLHLLREAPDVTLVECGRDALDRYLPEVEALINRSLPLPRARLEAAPRLRHISKHGIGVDNIDLPAATALGIVVTNTPAVHVGTVAEHALALILALAKRLAEGDAAVRMGTFQRRDILEGSGKVFGMDVEGKVLGIVGLGRIGRRLATMAQAGLGMRVIGYDPFVLASEVPPGVTMVSEVIELCRRSDFVSVHAPLNPETRGLIGAREIAAMKPTAYLVATSRGGVVDDAALAEALAQERIAGAGMDVFDPEPPPPGQRLPNVSGVLCRPHMAGLTDEAVVRLAEESATAFLQVHRDELPAHLVNPEAWSRRRPF